MATTQVPQNGRETAGARPRRGGLVAGDTEARPGIITTEFWLTLATSVIIVIAGYVDEGFTVGRAWTLATVILAAYILSRGIAKAGSSERYVADMRDND